jgi:hypothetical protein
MTLENHHHHHQHWKTILVEHNFVLIVERAPGNFTIRNARYHCDNYSK